MADANPQRQSKECGDGQPVLTNMVMQPDTIPTLDMKHCWAHPKIYGLMDVFGEQAR